MYGLLNKIEAAYVKCVKMFFGFWEIAQCYCNVLATKIAND